MMLSIYIERKSVDTVGKIETTLTAAVGKPPEKENATRAVLEAVKRKSAMSSKSLGRSHI